MPLGPWSREDPKPSTSQSTLDFNGYSFKANDPVVTGVLLLSAGAVVGIVGARVNKKYFRRIRNSDWVTPDMFARKRVLRGYVTRCVIFVSLWQALLMHGRVALEMRTILGCIIHQDLAGDGP
jgi:hypothetical protein